MRDGLERRQSKRIEKKIPLHFRAVGPISQQTDALLISGTSVDVCENDRGVGLVTEHPLYSRETLVIWKENAVRTAEVRWVSVAPAGYRAGAFLV